MKKNSNKKSIFIIFLTSMLALMLSIATLFTLPTFSASAVEGVPEDDVVTCRELKVGDKIKTGVSIVVESADDFYISVYSGSQGVFQLNRLRLTKGNEEFPSQMLPIESGNCTVYAYFLPKDDTIEGLEITQIFGEGDVGQEITYKIYDYSIPDTSNYTATDCAAGTNLAGKFIRVEYDTKEAIEGTLMLKANSATIFVYNNQPATYYLNTERTLLYCNDYETYVDIYIPTSVDATITDVLIEDFSNYAINVYELTAPAGVPEEVPEDENEDFLQGIKDKVNNGANIASEWIEEHFGVTIAGSTLIIVAVAVVIVLIVRRRRR